MIRFTENTRWSDLSCLQRFSKVYTLVVPAWRHPVVKVESTDEEDGLSRDEMESLFSDVLARRNTALCVSSQDTRQLRQESRLCTALVVKSKRSDRAL